MIVVDKKYGNYEARYDDNTDVNVNNYGHDGDRNIPTNSYV